MKRHLSSASKLFLPLLLVCFSAATAQRRCEKQVFRAETNTWLRKNFLTFAFERSIGPSSLTIAVGGGWLGRDEQYLPPEKMNSMLDVAEIHNSQTFFPDVVPQLKQERPYLQRVNTNYTGGLMRIGYAYYLHGRRCDDRLKGLYTGLDLSLLKTFEDQALIYHYIKANKSYEVSSVNRFWTLGVALHVGYQWLFLNDHLALNTRVQHPFYIPFTEEINTNSPFAGNHWELNIGIGCRIGAK
ncbi:MAG: hypothetical protein FD123_1740 [Bacteroidetes bacterium]|nr:MAG: hypothetical protein FD123_1740 [Bacteroidota bacterium]